MANQFTLSVFEREFQPLTLTEFCRRYGIADFPMKEEGFGLEQFTDQIEAQGVSYFYASYCQADILEAFQAEPQVDHQAYDMINLENELCLAVLR